METVYLISKAKMSGPVNQALNILIGLNRIPGVHATLVTLAPEDDSSWLYRFKDNSIDIVQLNQSYFHILKAIRLLKKYIKEHRIDVVHSAGFRADFVNMNLRKLVKTVSTQRCQPDEMVEKFPKLIRPPFEKYHLHILSKIHTVVACSKSLQSHFLKFYRMDVFAVQNGVNTDFFLPVDSSAKTLLRKNLGIKQDKLTYVTLGRLGERKNVGLIIDAFRLIDNKDVQLLIVGGGPLEDELKRKAYGDNRFIFTGQVSKPIDYLQASDYLISSSFAEGLPNTVLEALSCGLPCILSDIEPHKELLANTNTGVLFNHYDVSSLVEAVKQSLSWNLNEMKEHARRHAIQCFSIDKLANDYYVLYKSIV